MLYQNSSFDLELEKQKEARLLAQLELDKKKWEDEKEQRAINLDQKSIQNMQMRALNLQTSMEFVAKLSGGHLEPNDREFYKEIMLNITKNNNSFSSSSSSTSLTTTTSSKGEQITLAIVAQRLGYKLEDGDLCQLGKLLAKNYRQLHQREPEKHTQRHHGRMIPVNTYFTCDLPLVEETIHEYYV